ncbi:tetratricopeptide repeat protein [Flavivirga spongiicola]|uniref:Tetratricopeptide repeat protein n=1 Tax=Flavivirga spongiicola TaxID=421621 RepID=A0ABU7XTS9_9FLAO|nr:tetratricopeptide repeat protein [Flavivirga sp. MEBiC05379]MDO5979192.1 tetratricopeptide repeat protein [Flavivirga sp. MEBiC05379]
MGKRHIILILFLIPCIGLAQLNKSNLLGSWVKIKTEMKDSSYLIPVYPDYIKHFEMVFRDNDYDTDYYPAQKKDNSNSKYKLRGNRIVASKHFAYEVEKLNKDSLIIVEQMKGVEDDKLKRHYLIKKANINLTEKQKHISSNHLIANPYYTPQFSQNLERYLNRGLQKTHKSLSLKGTINILLKDKKVRTEITYRDKDDPFREGVIVNLLNETFNFWDVSGFENYDSIAINFVIIMEKTKTYRGLNIGLLTDSFTQLRGLYGLTYEQIRDGNKYFNLGLSSFQKDKFDEAIKYFTKSFEINHTKVDALYNRAACYVQKTEYLKACYDWARLAELGQKRGEKLLKENCVIEKTKN